MRASYLPILFLFISSNYLQNQTTPNLELGSRKHTSAVRLTESINIDGSLSETAWQLAPIATDFTQTELTPGKPSNYKTGKSVYYFHKKLFILKKKETFP